MAMLGAPEGMAVTDSQDRIVQANPALCELLGVSTVALIGHRFRDSSRAEDRQQVDQWRERLLLRAGHSIERCQHRLTGPTSEVWVDHSVGVIRDDLRKPGSCSSTSSPTAPRHGASRLTSCTGPARRCTPAWPTRDS